MIKTRKEKRDGQLGTVCDVKGSQADVMNDFRAILTVCIDNPELLGLLSEAIGTLDQELQDRISMLGVEE